MCKGTRCTHHEDPAVQYLEQPYDGWQYRQNPIYGETRRGDYMPPIAAYLIRVEGRFHSEETDQLIGLGPSHDQAMIRIKDDLGRMADWTDEQFSKYINCDACRLSRHKCFKCNQPIMHMDAGLCDGCLRDSESEFARILRETLNV